MLTLKLHYIIRINKRTLPCIALSLYLLQEMSYAIFSIAFGGGGTARIFTIIVMYLPLIAMLFFQGDKRDVKDFYVLMALIAAFFCVTYLFHPEYYEWFFEGSYPIKTVIFRPDQCIFAYLFFRVIKDPKDILKTLKITAYILLLYYSYQLLHALSVGYWLYNSTGEVEKWSYNLNYGYNHLLVMAIFGYFAMKEKKLFYWILCGISVLEIILGGSRGPLVGVGIFGILLILRFFKEMDMRLRVFLIVASIFALILFVGIGLETILQWVSSIIKSLGISSRTIDMLLQGEIADDNNRSRIYETAIQMIRNGGLFGYGAYGDRYVIGNIAFVGYCHNIILEILIDFGILLGGIFCLRMFYASIKIMFFAQEKEWGDIYMILFVSVTKLFLSGSFWYSEAFWGALAVWISYKKAVKKKKSQMEMKGNEEWTIVQRRSHQG